MYISVRWMEGCGVLWITTVCTGFGHAVDGVLRTGFWYVDMLKSNAFWLQKFLNIHTKRPIILSKQVFPRLRPNRVMDDAHFLYGLSYPTPPPCFKFGSDPFSYDRYSMFTNKKADAAKDNTFRKFWLANDIICIAIKLPSFLPDTLIIV